MSYAKKSVVARARLVAPALLLITLAACSGKDETAAPAASGTPAAKPAAPAAPAAPAVSAQVQSMGTAELRESASQALRDNRMYAPAGNNAMEYYLALRDKTPDDASVKSALTDLLPYTLIAAEQNLAREDFEEGQRLIALIEKVDPNAPALPRLRQGVTRGEEVAALRTTEEAERAKREAEAKTKQQAEQRTREAEAARQIAAQQDAARTDAPRPADTAREDAERQAAARREAEQRQQQAAAQQAAAARQSTAAAPALRPVSTPAPRYPTEALRSGTSGEVLVEITVGTDGSVTNARVLRATPARTFDREALNAVKRWRFEPVAAPVTTRRTLAFSPGG
ncbi:energy transducer TonB [Xanthomonas sp. 60]